MGNLLNQFIDEKRIKKLGAAFFYLSVTLELAIVIIDKSNYTNPIEGQLFRITFLLAACKVLLTKYTWKEWLAVIGFSVFGFVSYKMTGRNEILRIVVFLAACKGMDKGHVLKYVFYVTLSGCLALVILSVTGIYGGLYIETDFGRGYEQIRYCLGLGHPNALHCMFLMLVLLYLYLYQAKQHWYHYLLLFLLNHGLYLLTDSNTGMLMTFCAIFGSLLLRYVKKLSGWKLVYEVGAAVFLLCVIFSVLAAEPSFAQPDNYWFKNPLIYTAESKLNGRIVDLYYGSVGQEGTTPTWSLWSVPENSYYFDMGFVRLFYWYGIIPGAVWVVLNLLLVIQFYKKKDSAGLLMLTVLAVYTVVEAHVVSVYIGRNYLLFVMGMYAGDLLRVSGGEEEYLPGSYRFFIKSDLKSLRKG